MKVLLDTNVFLWALSEPQRLSRRQAALFDDRSNELLVSLATVWEMAIKIALGKLNLSVPLDAAIREEAPRLGVNFLPIELTHLFETTRLPRLHRDPFDHLLVAQARVEKIPLASGDHALKRYDVKLIG